MIVERIRALAFFLHDLCARLRVDLGPPDVPVLEQVTEKVLDPLGEAVLSLAGSEPANTVKHLPDGDVRGAEPLISD
ncbi:MAG: hypothetical protein OXG16_12760 [Rhodospirillales bacterium]|nr:hypothetical protein [Rhodospirillales bacterium]